MKSLRTYLISRLLLGSGLVLIVAGGAAVWTLQKELRSQFDEGLTGRVQGLASLLFQRHNQLSFEFSGELMPEYEREEEPCYFQLTLTTGQLVERSEWLEEESLDLDVPGSPTEVPSFWTAPLPDGRSGRYAAQQVDVHHVYPEEGPERPEPAQVVVVVAVPRSELVLAEARVLLLVVLGAAGILVGLALLSWHVVGRGLGPAGRLARALDRIDVDALPEGLEDVGQVPRELASIAQTSDALIGRVQSALERERRTSADIAHELRTPLSELLTVSEVALCAGEDRRELRRALITVRDVAWRMERSVSTLLALARVEMGDVAFSHEAVDLAAIVGETRRSLAAQERERGLELDVDLGLLGQVTGDPGVLRIVISNLIGNALAYTPEEGSVRVRLERESDHWSFVVENDAPNLVLSDLPVLTQPFWRKDGARVDRDRSGLGLALSRALAERVGLRLEFELVDRTFRARIAG